MKLNIVVKVIIVKLYSNKIMNNIIFSSKTVNYLSESGLGSVWLSLPSPHSQDPSYVATGSFDDKSKRK